MQGKQMLDIAAQCKDANLIGITGHVNPDGDCVASTMAMWQFLKKCFPDKEIYVLLEEPAPIFAFIRGVSEILVMDDKTPLSEEQKNLTFDLMIVIDTVLDRTGNAYAYIERAGKVINIDHHISNPGQGDISVIDPEASASAQIVYELITCTPEYQAMMDKEMAQTLYTGIIHDSGVLQYSNTSPKTLRIVADLIAYGFDFPRLIDETFYERTQVQSRITGKALLDAQLILGGMAVVSLIDLKTMREMGAQKKDLTGIVTQLRYIKGVEVAVFIYETKRRVYKVSLRSCGGVDVAGICSKFGGGGHVRAAGCTMEGDYKDIVQKISDQIAAELPDGSGADAGKQE